MVKEVNPKIHVNGCTGCLLLRTQTGRAHCAPDTPPSALAHSDGSRCGKHKGARGSQGLAVEVSAKGAAAGGRGRLRVPLTPGSPLTPTPDGRAGRPAHST